MLLPGDRQVAAAAARELMMETLDIATQAILCLLVAAVATLAGRLLQTRRRGRMTVRCAWCKRVIRIVVLEPGDHDCVSDGICGPCAARHFGEDEHGG